MAIKTAGNVRTKFSKKFSCDKFCTTLDTIKIKIKIYNILLSNLNIQKPFFYSSFIGFMVGKNNTSRIEAASVKSIISLSIPMPKPPVGGIPYSNA